MNLFVRLISLVLQVQKASKADWSVFSVQRVHLSGQVKFPLILSVFLLVHVDFIGSTHGLLTLKSELVGGV